MILHYIIWLQYDIINHIVNVLVTFLIVRGLNIFMFISKSNTCW